MITLLFKDESVIANHNKLGRREITNISRLLNSFTSNDCGKDLKELMESYMKRTCEANAASENSSFIFTVCVKSVPLYHFKLRYVVLHMTVK